VGCIEGQIDGIYDTEGVDDGTILILGKIDRYIDGLKLAVGCIEGCTDGK